MKRLSSLDMVQAGVYTRALYLVEAPHHVDTLESWFEVADGLKASLNAFVRSYLPLLTAELHREVAPPERGAMFFKDVGSKPPVFAAAELDWFPPSSSLMSGCTEKWPLDDLLLKSSEDEEVAIGEEGCPLKVKATWCKSDGKSIIALVVYLHHNVGDGASVAMLVTKWADFHRDGEPGLTDPPVHNPSRLTGRRDEPNGEAPDVCKVFAPAHGMAGAMAFFESIGTKNVRLRFPRKLLNELKMDADRRHGFSNGERYTDNDVACAHLWQSLQRASDPSGTIDAAKPVHLMIPVTLRKRFEDLPAEQFGNCFINQSIETTVGALRNEPLPVVAKLVHEAVKTARYPSSVHRFMDWEASLEQREPGFYMPAQQISLFSNNVFPWLDVNFFGNMKNMEGKERPFFFSIIPGAAIPHSAFLVPSPPRATSDNNGGGMDIIIGLPKETVKHLTQDVAFKGTYLGVM